MKNIYLCIKNFKHPIIKTTRNLIFIRLNYLMIQQNSKFEISKVTLGCKEIETKNLRLWQGYSFFLSKCSIIQLLHIQRQENKFVIVLSKLGMKFMKVPKFKNCILKIQLLLNEICKVISFIPFLKVSFLSLSIPNTKV